MDFNLGDLIEHTTQLEGASFPNHEVESSSHVINLKQEKRRKKDLSLRFISVNKEATTDNKVLGFLTNVKSWIFA